MYTQSYVQDPNTKDHFFRLGKGSSFTVVQLFFLSFRPLVLPVVHDIKPCTRIAFELTPNMYISGFSLAPPILRSDPKNSSTTS